MSITILKSITDLMERSVDNKELLILRNLTIKRDTHYTVDFVYKGYDIKIVHDTKIIDPSIEDYPENYVMTFIVNYKNTFEIKTDFHPENEETIENLILSLENEKNRINENEKNNKTPEELNEMRDKLLDKIKTMNDNKKENELHARKLLSEMQNDIDLIHLKIDACYNNSEMNEYLSQLSIIEKHMKTLKTACLIVGITL